MTGSGITRNQAALLLFLVLGLGLGLRLWGLGFGLPELNHADEPIVVNHALAYGTGDFHPHFFNIPPLSSYLLFIVYGFYYLSGLLLGIFSGKEDFLNLFLSNPSSFYYLGRVFIGAFFGVLSIYVSYRLSRLLWDRAFALTASALMAVLYLPVFVSHFIYPDSPLLFAMILSLYFYMKIYKKGRTKDYLGAILVTGFAIALKYNAALLAIPFLTAHYLKMGVNGSGVGDSKSKIFILLGVPVLIGLGIGVVFFILNPYFFFDWSFALKELREQGHSTGFQGWAHHLLYSLKEGIGLPMLILFLLSFFLGIFSLKKDRYLVIFYMATLVFYLHLVFFAQPYSRYGILLIPQAVIFSIWGIAWIEKRFKMKKITTVVLVAVFLLPIYKSVALGTLLSKEDTRGQAKNWFLKTIPGKTKVFFDIPRFQPRLPYCEDDLREVLEKADPDSPQAKRTQALIKINQQLPCFYVYYPGEKGDRQSSEFLLSGRKITFDGDEIMKEGIRYVGITRLRPNYPKKEILEFLERNGELVARFSPYWDPSRSASWDPIDMTGAPTTLKDLKSRQRNGHLIEIYKLKG